MLLLFLVRPFSPIAADERLEGKASLTVSVVFVTNGMKLLLRFVPNRSIRLSYSHPVSLNSNGNQIYSHSFQQSLVVIVLFC